MCNFVKYSEFRDAIHEYNFGFVLFVCFVCLFVFFCLFFFYVFSSFI